MPFFPQAEMSTLQKLTRKLALLFIIMMFMAGSIAVAEEKEEG